MSEKPTGRTPIPLKMDSTFAAEARKIRLPPLPVAVARLISEINRPDPDMERLVEVLSANSETATKVLQTVNSSIFALRHPVISVRHAVALLGLRHIRPIALSFAMAGALPRPSAEVFDHEGFWSDSLIRAMFARSFAGRCAPGEKEIAFTAALLADLAIPVLLMVWPRQYAPVLTKWRTTDHRLSEMEKQLYGWEHGAAGAHILDAWGLPAELNRLVAAHVLDLEAIRQQEETAGINVAIAVAARAPSVQRPNDQRAEDFVRTALGEFAFSPGEMVALISQTRAGFEDVCGLFEIKQKRAFAMLDQLVCAASRQEEIGEAA
ncbi:MAG: HDOD domain-containing protein [Candidatus Eisenbacteria bacterium]